MEATRNNRRTLQGTVVSDGMDKTISVRVERVTQHPKYRKYVRVHKKYMAHDEENQAQVGDVVNLVECRPLSKNKRWRLHGIVRKASIIEGGEL